MTKLSEQISEVNGELEVYKGFSSDNTTVREYKFIIDKLESIPESIERSISEIKMLSILNGEAECRVLDADEVKILGLTNEAFKAFRDHWNKEDVNARQGEFLDDFLNVNKLLTNGMREKNKLAWTECLNAFNLKVLDHHLLIDDQLEFDKEASARTSRFKSASVDYKSKTRKIPTNVIDANYVLALVDELEQILNEATSKKLPDDVLKFIKAAKTYDGAPLELLTEEVKAFLESKKQIGVYSIKLRMTCS